MRSAYPLHRLPHSTVLSALVTMYPCHVLTTADLPKDPGTVPVCLSGGSLWNPNGHQPLHPPLPSATKGWKACPFTETEGTALFIPLTHTLIHTLTPSHPHSHSHSHPHTTHTSLTSSITPSSHPHSHSYMPILLVSSSSNHHGGQWCTKGALASSWLSRRRSRQCSMISRR